MGDIAEMMLDGTLDSITGEYLGDSCGYPRSTTDGTYWDDAEKLKKSSRQCIHDLCKNIGIEDRGGQQLLVTSFLQCIGIARLPKMQRQMEMVFLHHKKDFKLFLAQVQSDLNK